MSIIDRPPRGGRFKDLSGKVFSGITALSLKGFDRHNIAYWNCRCHCGKDMVCSGSHLISGHTTSCGCSRIRHGHTRHARKSPEYSSWRYMIRRCTNPKDRKYKHYGGRGITVCDEWMQSFESFISSMGRRPSPKHTLGRIDNEKGYFPENCRWETYAEQNINKRNNHHLSAMGKTQTISEWAKEIGCKYHFILSRIRGGWKPEEVIRHAIRVSARREG
jgi:hypothetical protein